MTTKFTNPRQKELFELISKSGELIFATGTHGLSANIVGEFKINHFREKEHRLDMGDGTNHVHIDWSKITSFECGSFHGEGMLTFFSGDDVVFKLYRMAGEFSEPITSFNKDLI